VRVGVLLSGEGTNLQALLDDGEIDVVCAGSSRPDARGVERAQEAGVATGVFPSGDYPDRAERDAALAEWLESHDVELVVLAGFMELLSPAFIARFPGRIVNVHPALLPAFPGVRAIEQALEHGVKVMGVTVHFVDEGVDSGPVILQERLRVAEEDTADTLRERLHEIEHRLLPYGVRLFLEGKASP